jgi:hypothetical protein
MAAHGENPGTMGGCTPIMLARTRAGSRCSSAPLLDVRRFHRQHIRAPNESA